MSGYCHKYVKHLMSFDRFMEKKEYVANLESAAQAVLKVGLTLKKHSKVLKGEKTPCTYATWNLSINI